MYTNFWAFVIASMYAFAMECSVSLPADHFVQLWLGGKKPGQFSQIHHK